MIMKEYKKEDVTILWNAEKCTHSGVCARGLSVVFKPKERPWIQTDNASKDEIVQQVLKCPSGALSIKK
ncbi:MAG: (4Fe-4S)-binding protein [Crocinitomicaceae bacterium]|nr:(4Fe-4S)-binding protein [Crocinitomicaceae bacterium]